MFRMSVRDCCWEISCCATAEATGMVEAEWAVCERAQMVGEKSVQLTPRDGFEMRG